MQYTVKFNYLNKLSFSMTVEAKSHKEALRIIKSSITDDRIFTFSKNVNLEKLEIENIEQYFFIESPISSKYCYIFEDDEPTRPDIPSLLSGFDSFVASKKK